MNIGIILMIWYIIVFANFMICTLLADQIKKGKIDNYTVNPEYDSDANLVYIAQANFVSIYDTNYNSDSYTKCIGNSKAYSNNEQDAINLIIEKYPQKTYFFSYYLDNSDNLICTIHSKQLYDINNMAFTISCKILFVTIVLTFLSSIYTKIRTPINTFAPISINDEDQL
jgi:hypothetical protein